MPCSEMFTPNSAMSSNAGALGPSARLSASLHPTLDSVVDSISWLCALLSGRLAPSCMLGTE